MECLFLQDLSFVLLVLLPWTVSGKFTVIGPQQPVIAMVGGEALFPCHLSPQMDAQDMDVMWFYGESSELVHHYKYRQDYLKYQHQDYKGRTEVLRDGISIGSVALKLHHIRPSDEGKYQCLFESSRTYGVAEYQVYVAGKGSAPHIYIMSDGNKSLRLVCTSTGWYPEPEIHWRMNQEMLLSENTTIQKKENGLFSIETSIKVSTKSIVNISCLIWNPLLRQKLEASVSMSDDLFPKNTPWIVTVVLLITGIPILIFVIWKLKKVKGVNKEEPGVNKDLIDVYKDEPVVNKEEPVSYPSANFENKFDINNDRWDQASRTLETIEWNGMQKWANPGNIQEEQRGIEPSSFFHHEEVQEGDQKKMEGNLSPSSNTSKTPDLQTAQKYRVDVTLDADTICPFLLPLIDGKSLSSSSHKIRHKVIGGWETLECVLGNEKFTSGRCYWEVQVEDTMKWIVGLCKDSVIRKEGYPGTPASGFWAISLKKGSEYWAHSSPPTHLHLRVAPKVVGIFLDYEAGCISFYNVTDDSHIYTFQDTFREALWTFMYPPDLSIGKHCPYYHPPKAGDSQAL